MRISDLEIYNESICLELFRYKDMSQFPLQYIRQALVDEGQQIDKQRALQMISEIQSETTDVNIVKKLVMLKGFLESFGSQVAVCQKTDVEMQENSN